MVTTFIGSLSEEAVRSALNDLKIADDFVQGASEELVRETLEFLVNVLPAPPTEDMINRINYSIGFARNLPEAIRRLDEGYSGTEMWIDALIDHYKNAYNEVIARMNGF